MNLLLCIIKLSTKQNTKYQVSLGYDVKLIRCCPEYDVKLIWNDILSKLQFALP